MPDPRPKRKAEAVEVPELDQDPAERKRLLNVLAQRRYRQRKKEHVKELEAQVNTATESQSTPNAVSVSSDQPSDNSTLSPLTQQTSVSHPSMSTNKSTSQSDQQLDPRIFEPMDEPTALNTDRDLLSATHHQAQSRFTQSDIFASYDSDGQMLCLPVDDECFWDMSVVIPSLPNSPLSTSTGTSSTGSIAPSMVAHPLADDSDRLSPQQSSRQASRLPFLQPYAQYSFPDEAHLEVLELDLLRGCMAIATRLNVQESMWSLAAQSPFTDPTISLEHWSHLPDNLQPTIVQMTVPHHPIIDLLPWPAVRDRMANVMAQPVQVRPPQAASPLALLDFVYDIEDSSEGIRISGNDPYSGINWEIGEKVFKSWWWIFDRGVIQRSNELRQQRGAPILGSSMGAVLGEVL
ncbi:hypothetical protein PV10_08134 [Exophiala mesophila]|uniref:BZIP domain-containing protein n=1 Tax=Exophiala mesophila TaxID=212818 RepID=A0A0D1XJS3_EXOME|nr:uncharacterized protein PV10_08134 [Exophiala mesophila]KIV88451.1 hypothetical protein PV10_08134 [Exophiala mesophila]